jgi:hypothetical protein
MHHTPEHTVRSCGLEFREEVDRFFATHHHTPFHRATLAPEFDAPRRPRIGYTTRDQVVQCRLVDRRHIDTCRINLHKVEITRLIFGRWWFPETQDSLNGPRGNTGRERARETFPCGRSPHEPEHKDRPDIDAKERRSSPDAAVPCCD